MITHHYKVTHMMSQDIADEPEDLWVYLTPSHALSLIESLALRHQHQRNGWVRVKVRGAISHYPPEAIGQG